MYIVTIQNGNIRTEIHGENESVLSGNVTKGINVIDSLTMSLHPANAGFDKLQDFQTLVDVYNTRKNRYEFFGRVLYSVDGMDESGLITKDVTCESFFGFLCDSEQYYVQERNWTVNGLFSHLIDVHNAQVEDYKKFHMGEITVTDPNNNLYVGIQRRNTWEAIKEKLIGKLGGEIRFRVVDGEIYIDYLVQIGETKETAISLSRNMKSILREKNPSEYVTRLIPLGAKLNDETEERLDITSVNDGKNYIDDEEAIAKYGIHVKSVEFDDVTEASNLLSKGQSWLTQNNKLKVKYTATALDLSLLGLDIDDFDVFNTYPILNDLLGIDDTARIIKKNIDICEEVKTAIEFGEKFETLTESINKKQGEYATQADLSQTNLDLANKIGRDENDQIVSMLNASASVITINANRIIIDSDYFSLSAEGEIEAKKGTLDGLDVKNCIIRETCEIKGKLTASDFCSHNGTNIYGRIYFLDESTIAEDMGSYVFELGNSQEDGYLSKLELTVFSGEGQVKIYTTHGYLDGDWKLNGVSIATKDDISALDERLKALEGTT